VFESLVRQRVAPGMVIFRQGDRGDCAYVIESGAVEISAMRLGGQVVLARLGAGDLFGEMALVDDAGRSATARAVESATLMVIRREQVTRKINAADPLIALILRIVLQRLRATSRRVERSTPAAAAPPGGASLDDTAMRRLRARAIGMLDREQQFESALDRGEFEVCLQPIVDLRTARAAGFEALVRWRQADGSVVEPDAFLGLMEEIGLIDRLGRLVLERSCDAVRGVPAPEGTPGEEAVPPFVSLNLSATQLAAPGMVEEFSAAVRAAGIDPRRVVVEVTESVLMEDPERVASVLRRLKSDGHGVFVDDFGTGYSSLAYLQHLPVDVLKIDRSFITAAAPEGDNGKIVRAVARLAQELQLGTVAEGVERPSDLALVRACGCDLAQGFLFAPPVALTELAEVAQRCFFPAPGEVSK